MVNLVLPPSVVCGDKIASYRLVCLAWIYNTIGILVITVLIFSMMGWRVRAKPNGPRGSPC